LDALKFQLSGAGRIERNKQDSSLSYRREDRPAIPAIPARRLYWSSSPANARDAMLLVELQLSAPGYSE
jgi:hypothetical protein